MNAQDIIAHHNEIYDRFFVTNSIRNHLLRTAAVARFLVRRCQLPADENLVCAVMLLHDLGNIVKTSFQGSRFFQYETKPRQEWLTIKEQIIKKYGEFDDEATSNMLDELGVSRRIRNVLESAKNDKILQIIENDDWAVKICAYADYRVGPESVLSLSNRFIDLEERYKKKPLKFRLTNKQATIIKKGFFSLEKQLFAQTKCSPEDISEESIQQFLVRSLISAKK